MQTPAKVFALGSLLVFSAFALLFGTACGGAQKVATPEVSAPQVLSVPNDANPDTVWVVKQVVVPKEDGGVKVLYGLFACYRSATPAAPKCFLAGTAWNPEDLQWPGAYMLTDTGVLTKK